MAGEPPIGDYPDTLADLDNFCAPVDDEDTLEVTCLLEALSYALKALNATLACNASTVV